MERLQASFYIFFFTIVFSLPFLIFLFLLEIELGRVSFSLLKYFSGGHGERYYN